MTSSTRYDGPKHDGPASTSPYPLSRMSAPHDLVDTARAIQEADAILATVATDKLSQIAEQIRALQDQARDVLERARRDAELHRAECRFQKVAGQTYHLYRRTRDGSDALYFSMLSPADWRGAPPDAFAGSFRLEADQSFTPAEEAAARDARFSTAKRLLASGG
jgi:hypothetical protein